MPNNPIGSIKQGLIFTVAIRWIDRLIGITSTLILARLLAPEDFGIIAMAAITIGFADTLLNIGVNVVLIQKKSPDQNDYNTAWTLRLLQTIAVTLILIISAPYIGVYFNDPRVTDVVGFLSLTILFSGLENIGIIDYQKNLQFNLEFRILFAKRFIGFIATIASAYYLQSYFALVIGSLVWKGSGIILSYVLHPMRPRICFSKSREILSVSQWLLINGIGLFLHNNLHKMLVGRYSSADVMGRYTISDEIASMPTSELLAPVNRVLFPAFSRAKDNIFELKKLFLLSQGYQSLLAIPAAIGLAAVAPEAVLVLLGEKWISAVPFIQGLAILNVVQAVGTSCGYILLATNKAKIATLDCWLQLTIFILLAASFIPTGEPIYIIWLRLVIAFMSLGLAFWRVQNVIPGLKIAEILNNIYRPVAASAMMAFFIINIYPPFSTIPFSILLEKIFVGGSIYTITTLALWAITGKPAGAESEIISKSVYIYKTKFSG